ncbi:MULTISPECIES: ATP-binding protein [Colwellia]|uniref:ATP-binding protein n=1 Tax=Colwellia marinimaniae TaxID=1513592 RepID=A0ABQ0MVS9_9GAMM|nr:MULTISPECIES: ATP-binding protein [Colwellia]GAW96463.1 ATP-binding protein [Colwellia marinimaniae]
MAEHGYSLLRIIIIDSFWQGQVNELDLTGHTQLEGTNGAGKTSLMRLLPLFYGMRPSDIVSKVDQAKNFADFYLPRESSILVYEYCRPYGQICQVLATSDGRGVQFKFIDAPYDAQHFIANNQGSKAKPFTISEIEKNYRSINAESSKFLGIDKYRQVIQNLRSGRQHKEIRLLQNRFSFSEQPCPHIDKVINGTIEKNLDFEAVKRMLVAIASDHLARDTNEEKEQLSLNKADITGWLADIQASRAIKKVADKISVWQNDFSAFASLLNKLQHLHAEVIAHQQRLEIKQQDRDELKKTSIVTRNTLDTELANATEHYQKALFDLNAKIDADLSKIDLLDADKLNYEDDDASSYQIKAEQAPHIQQELNEVIAVIDAFEGNITKIGQKFDKLIQKIEVEKLKAVSSNNEKSALITATTNEQLTHINDVFHQQEYALNAQLHKEELKLQKDRQQIQHQLDHANQQLTQPIIPQQLTRDIDDNMQALTLAQQSYNQLLQQESELQKQQYQLEKQQDQQLAQRSDANRYLEQLRQDYQQVELQLLPQAGSLHHYLINEPQAGNWQNDIGRLLTSEQLSRSDLNPQWLASDSATASLYGLSIDLQQLPCDDSLFLDEAQLREKRQVIETKLQNQTDKISQLDEHLKGLVKALNQLKVNVTEQTQNLNQQKLTLGQLQTQQESLVIKKQLAIKAHRQSIETQLQSFNQQIKMLDKKQHSFEEDKTEQLHDLTNDKLEKCMVVESDRDNQLTLLAEQLITLKTNAKQRSTELKKQQASDIKHLDPEGEVDKRIAKRVTLEQDLQQCSLFAQKARDYQSFLNERYCHRDALVEENQNRKITKRNLESNHEDISIELTTKISELRQLIKKTNLEKQATDDLLIQLNDNKRLCEMSAIDSKLAEQEPANQADLTVSFCHDFYQQFKTIEKRLASQLNTFSERFRKDHSGSELYDNWQNLLVENDNYSGAQALFKYREPISALLNSAEQKQQSTYQLVTVNATMINEFYQHIENFGRNIKRIGKLLSAKVTALAHFEALADINVTTVMKQEELEYWGPLKSFAEVFELHKDQLRDGIGEVPDDLVFAMQKLANYLPSEGFVLVHNNLFDLEFTIVEKGQIKYARNAKQLKKVSSTGLSYLAMLSLFAGLLGMLRGDSKHASQIILPVDELGELAAENIDLLLQMFNDNNISMLSASPSTDRHILSLYNRHYKLKDNKIYHAEIPQSRLDELLAQRNKVPDITDESTKVIAEDNTAITADESTEVTAEASTEKKKAEVVNNV